MVSLTGDPPADGDGSATGAAKNGEIPPRGVQQPGSRLLNAVISVSRDLRLRDVLQRIVGFACELADAQYGAIGVTGPDRDLVDVIFQGLDDRQAAAIGNPPIGCGLLGELIEHPAPVRLADLTEHPHAFGFPPNHPPMRTFLGVPLKVRDEVFGNLYVTEKRGGGTFTAEDQETLVALATAAEIAVENARLFERGLRRERWLQASNEITAALLAGTGPTGELRLVTERARAIAGAPVAAIALPHDQDPGTLVFRVVDGLGSGDADLVGITIDVASTASGMVYSTGKPLLIDEYGESAAAWQDEHNGGVPAKLRRLGSAAIVPLAAGEHVLGVLLLSKFRGEQPFAEGDLDLFQNFAAHAALALQYAKARADQRRLAVFEDRDRIAGDMQDLVITRLFDIGLGLQGVARLVRPDLRRRVTGLVDQLDETISDLRRSIFSLQDAGKDMPGSLDETVRHTARQAEDALGYAPVVRLDTPLEPVVPQRFRPDLLATLREALANVARHANASSVTVEIRVDRGLTLEVFDDGVGIPAARVRNSGLANLGRRAQRWDGSLTVESTPGGGTRLTWTVPLAPG